MMDDGNFICDECKQPLVFDSMNIKNKIGSIVGHCEKCRVRYEITFSIIMITQMKMKEEDFSDLEAL